MYQPNTTPHPAVLSRKDELESLPPHLGSRGEDFKKMIRGVLKKSVLKDSYIDDILSRPECMKIFDTVFTHKSVRPQDNYDIYESLGDVIVNKHVMWYLFDRVKVVRNLDSSGVALVSRWKIVMVQKEIYARFAKSLGFWEFISANQKIRDSTLGLLEDVLEAFFAGLNLIMENYYHNGTGDYICKSIIYKILDEYEHKSLKYHDLFDSITLLKELVDKMKSELKTGSQQYRIQQDQSRFATHGGIPICSIKDVSYNTINPHKQLNPTGDDKFQVTAYLEVQIASGAWKKIYIGHGEGFTVKVGKKLACENGLETLKNCGIYRGIPEYYQQFENFQF